MQFDRAAWRTQKHEAKRQAWVGVAGQITPPKDVHVSILEQVNVLPYMAKGIKAAGQLT